MSDYPSDDWKAPIESRDSVHAELKTIRDTLIEAVDAAEERSDSSEGQVLLSEHERMVFLEFFTISHVLIETNSIFLLKSEIIQPGYYKYKISDKLINRYLSQPQREKYLQDCEIIDKETKGKMKEVRLTRNNLVHNYDERQSIKTPHQVQNKANRAIEALEYLDSKIDDRIQEPDPEV